MSGSSFLTPEPLIKALRLDHMSFNQSLDYDVSSLTNYVNQITKQYKCQMSAYLTGIDLTEFLEKCQFPDFKREVSTFPDGSFACATFIS